MPCERGARRVVTVCGELIVADLDNLHLVVVRHLRRGGTLGVGLLLWVIGLLLWVVGLLLRVVRLLLRVVGLLLVPALTLARPRDLRTLTRARCSRLARALAAALSPVLALGVRILALRLLAPRLFALRLLALELLALELGFLCRLIALAFALALGPSRSRFAVRRSHDQRGDFALRVAERLAPQALAFGPLLLPLLGEADVRAQPVDACGVTL